MFMFGYPGYGWYPAPFMWAWGFLAILAVAIIVFVAMRWAMHPRWYVYGHLHHYYGHRSDEYVVLRMRYARGELTREQYEQMLRDLDSTRSC
ncbi:MAG TPA: SHOCT domain-containing protein [Nitrososphaeria archaeon]|jgi:putative membrane protein|nr:SHOCT domain-containing protein [Conexivisphaerales archaeon]HEU16657.1 SHOCT domain-containing protein [Nitrososphaeria archaeon]